jgi:rhodanese-related sulfurtransferase
MKQLILGFVLLFVASGVSAQTETDWKALTTMSGTKISAVEGATRIDIKKAKDLFDRGVRFIDTRGTSAWDYGHIPSALPLDYPTKTSLSKVANKNEEVVFYCDCDIGSATCNRSPRASAVAISLGYQKVYYFSNSNKWSAAGYPIEKAK